MLQKFAIDRGREYSVGIKNSPNNNVIVFLIPETRVILKRSIMKAPRTSTSWFFCPLISFLELPQFFSRNYSLHLLGSVSYLCENGVREPASVSPLPYFLFKPVEVCYRQLSKFLFNDPLVWFCNWYIIKDCWCSSNIGNVILNWKIMQLVKSSNGNIWYILTEIKAINLCDLCKVNSIYIFFISFIILIVKCRF